MISPFAQLKPGESYTWHYDWYACQIGGDYPVLDCAPVGVTCEVLTARCAGNKLRIGGRFGVFYTGRVEAVFFDEADRRCGTVNLGSMSPRQPLLLSAEQFVPAAAHKVTLAMHSANGEGLGQLAATDISR